MSAKPLKGLGSGVLEVVLDPRGDTFRSVYTCRRESDAEPELVRCGVRIHNGQAGGLAAFFFAMMSAEYLFK